MKKIISSIMAVAMISGMSATAFASRIPELSLDSYSKLYFEKDGALYEAAEDEMFKPGDKLYIEVNSDDEEMVTAWGAKQYKTAASWMNGEEIFEKIALESKKRATKTDKLILEKGKKAPYNLKESYNNIEELLNDLNAVVKHVENCEIENCKEPSHLVSLSDEEKAEAVKMYTEVYTYDYRYFVGVYTKQSYNVNPVDLVGEIKLIKKNRSSSSDEATSVQINRTFGYETDLVNGIRHEIDNSKPVLDFSSAKGEVEIEIGETVEFEVNAENQKNIFMGYNTDLDFGIMEQNPEANMDFLNFIGKPEFNRVGEMRIYSDNEDLYVYEVTSTGLRQIIAKYDADYEAYVFKTRKLTSYVFSDRDIKFTSLD